MRRLRFLGSLLIAAACWLAAGPGGVVVQASLACQHQRMHHHHHGVPNEGGPCFCDQMGGGSDLSVSVTLAPPLPVGPIIAATVAAVSHYAPAPLARSTFLPPPTPPPNAALVA